MKNGALLVTRDAYNSNITSAPQKRHSNEVPSRRSSVCRV